MNESGECNGNGDLITSGEYFGMYDVNPNTHNPFTGVKRCLKKHPKWSAITCVLNIGHSGDHVSCAHEWNDEGGYYIPKGYFYIE